ncbi:putative coagulation factor 5 8 type domain-containing protein [Rosellinia necatrix]|uniref:Putative coagulation factor 5 8 type domain-containing protein n=1 Tax=Rosellinia necatrix TaxID=77044 RepID=A0A1S7UNG9_ROSNE|nr:putative coagulation factor 5 8 type domain-containing protein [Rosellinia necatrix]
MKNFMFIGALLFELLFQTYALALNQAATSNIRSIFLFKDVMKSDTTALKTSGFNTVIMFGVGILGNGDIMYYSNTPGSSDVLAASNGTYVGGDALAAKVQSLKTGTTGITRVEICMNSQHVKDLMASPGPGPTTPLYRNFAALKAAWGLDAVNNDDESLYDVASTVQFAQMLGRIGYRYTIAPYTNSAFWVALLRQANAGLAEPDLLLDRAYLQCYDGGAGNNPASWAGTLGLKVVPLLWVTNDSKPSQGTTATQARTRFAAWVAAGGLAGGGYWNDYDIEKNGLSYTQYGGVLTSLFP